MNRSRAAVASIALTALLSAGAAFGSYRLTSPSVISGHDEGLYLAGAWSLRAFQGYRLVDLPSEPFQTKYPPVYSFLLALAGPRPDTAPGDLRIFKVVNALCLGLIVFLTGELSARLTGGNPVGRVIAALLASTSLGLVSHVDLICSDLLFVMLLLLAVLVLPISSKGSRWRAIGAGTLLGLAVLTRMVGVSAAVGAVAWVGHKNRRDGLLLALASGAFTLTWVLWTGHARNPAAGAIERYYTGYDNVAWFDVFRNPPYGWSVIAHNALDYARVTPMALGVPGLVIAGVLGTGMLLGIRTTASDPRNGLLASMGALYMLAVIGVPYVVTRYLLPAVPVACAWVGAAAISRRRSPAPPGTHGTAIIGGLCAALLLATNALELRHLAALPSNAVHVGFSQSLPFGKDGFLQTADWIRKMTPPDAILASANDTIYFLQTGRRGIRPWPYEPDRYNGAYSVSSPATRPDIVPAELRRIGVSYVVVDPFLPDLEGDHAARYMGAILASPEDRWTEVFVSDDGLHRVFRREELEPGRVSSEQFEPAHKPPEEEVR